MRHDNFGLLDQTREIMRQMPHLHKHKTLAA